MQTPLVSVDWLRENMDDPDLIILDATQKIDAETYKNNPDKLKIVKARYFNIKEVFSDTNSPYPNMLPSEDDFQKNCRALGISKHHKIVVYDSLGIYTSPRVWWMFNVMGFDQISVLDGGLPKWVERNFPAEAITEEDYAPGDFIANINSSRVQDIDFVKLNIDSQDHVLVDARSSGRFNGTAPEPRKGLASGCIPNSINIPFSTLLEDGCMKEVDSLKQIFASHDFKNKPITFSCGSGITACVVLLGMTLAMGEGEYSVYDGSWTEWALNHQS